VNSAANPAAQGSLVALYGTGAIWPSGMTGRGIPVTAAALNQEQNGFRIVDSFGVQEYILHARAVPDIIDGMFQINVEMPVGAKPPFTLAVNLGGGDRISGNPFTTYAQ
jgi:uncharacterized protein (TIGR03437 family)